MADRPASTRSARGSRCACTNAKNDAVVKNNASGKKLGLGVVDARNSKLETPQQIAERIRALSAGSSPGGVSPDNIYVSPSHGLEFLPREVAQEKLRRIRIGPSGMPSADTPW